ncbi:nestin [Pontoporia blainvillei]|uniref:Nestin n=1 Tax=Pontoporia blainvillei TaxID=48723 RepID=A0ABX0RZG8_PONBL|nr:nestin [Pontoporia blainvillei]
MLLQQPVGMQLSVEALEQEKQGLQSQIAQVLEGRQQLAHLKMSLSLEVATYRTLLEAENSRLQTPGSGSKASLSFLDPKLELHFPGTPEGRRLGPLLSVLSPTPLSSPLPDTLETPVPGFLKSQELLQAHAPTSASTPIPPTPQAPRPATDAKIRAQDAPLSLPQPQVGMQQVPEAVWAETKVAIPASVLPGPEEPGGKQQEPSPGQSSEDHASLAPALNPDHPSLEAKEGEPSGSRESSRFQEEGEGQTWGLAEKETAVEVKVISSLQQETWQEEGDLDMKEIQDSPGPLEKETLKSLEEEIQEPLISLEKQRHETMRSLEKGNQESLRSLEEENLETLKTLEKENQELLQPLEGKEMEVMRPLEKETLELPKPIGKEDPQTLQSLEKESQEVMRSLQGNVGAFLSPGKENQELVRSLEEENFESLRALEKERQEPLRCQEVENQETLRPLAKENQEPLRSLEEKDQETSSPLGKENQPLTSLEKEDQMTLSPLEKVKPEALKSLGKDQEIVRLLEKENQDLLRSLNEQGVEAVRSLETETLEPLKPTGEENLEILKPLEKESQEPLGSVEGNQETLRPLEKETQKSLSSLGGQSVEDMRSPEEVDKGSQRYLEEEENVEKGENPEPPRSLEEEGQELPLSAHLQKWEDTVQGGQELDQETPPGRPEVDSADEAEMEPRERDSFAGKGEAVGGGELQLTATGKAWSPGEGQPRSSEPKEQRVSAEGASGVGGTEGLQDPEERPEQVGTPGLPAPQGMSEVLEPVLEGEDVAPRDSRASPEVTLDLETAGAEQGPEQEGVGLEDPGGLAREEVMEPPLGEEGLEAERLQGLEGPRRELEEPAALEPELSTLPRKSRGPLDTARGWEESEPETPEEAEEMFPAETSCCDGSDAPQPRPLSSEGAKEDAKAVLGPPSPRPTESCSPIPIPEDAPGPQPLAEGSQEASWGLAGRPEVLGKAEGGQEDRGSGGIPEGLSEEGEESREESEADELGETLPDSTPLALYLGSPASPRWDLAGEQRPSRQEETGKEGWGPAILASEGLGAHPSEEEEGGVEEEERGHDSELSEEFEDLGTEASLLPGVPGEVAEPPGQVPPLLLEPAAWDPDGESDGFADEEESGEEGEEEVAEGGRGPGTGRWGAGPSVGSLLALSGPQRGNLLGSETMDVSVPWDDGLRGAASDAPMTALETESQDSTEASGSEEESDAIPLEREGLVPGPLGTLSGVEDTGLEVGDTLGVNGQGPSLKEELEHVNGGVVNGLEQSEGVRQGKPGPPEGDQGSPLEEEEEGGALKTPWAGAPLHLGQGQLLKFSQREGDGDSWSSGED